MKGRSMVSKILYFDIEWKPATAYVWRMWDENISPDQLIDPGGLLCFSALWEGEKTPLFYSEWEHGHHDMVVALHKLLSEADAVVTYNGDRRSEEHTSELQSLMRNSYAVFCLKKKQLSDTIKGNKQL